MRHKQLKVGTGQNGEEGSSVRELVKNSIIVMFRPLGTCARIYGYTRDAHTQYKSFFAPCSIFSKCAQSATDSGNITEWRGEGPTPTHMRTHTHLHRHMQKSFFFTLCSISSYTHICAESAPHGGRLKLLRRCRVRSRTCARLAVAVEWCRSWRKGRR